MQLSLPIRPAAGRVWPASKAEQIQKVAASNNHETLTAESTQSAPQPSAEHAHTTPDSLQTRALDRPASTFSLLKLPPELQEMVLNFHIDVVGARVMPWSRGRLAINSPLLRTNHELRAKTLYQIANRMAEDIPRIIVELTDFNFDTLKTFLRNLDRYPEVNGRPFEFWKGRKLVVSMTLSPHWCRNDRTLEKKRKGLKWASSGKPNKPQFDLTHELEIAEERNFAYSFVRHFGGWIWDPEDTEQAIDLTFERTEIIKFMSEVLFDGFDDTGDIAKSGYALGIAARLCRDWLRPMMREDKNLVQIVELAAEGLVDDPYVAHARPELRLCYDCKLSKHCDWLYYETHQNVRPPIPSRSNDRELVERPSTSHLKHEDDEMAEMGDIEGMELDESDEDEETEDSDDSDESYESDESDSSEGSDGIAEGDESDEEEEWEDDELLLLLTERDQEL